MLWKKLGHLYHPPFKNEYLQTHAANPLALPLRGNIYRIFYSGRNADNRSSVGCVDIDIITKTVVKDYQDCLFSIGDDDSFYSHGISIGNAFDRNNETIIPYMGWRIEKQDHWYGQIGSLVLNKNLDINAEKSGNLFMGLDTEDPVSLSYPYVLWDEGIYKMWYGSTITWDGGNDEMIHVIKYATSANGTEWRKHGIAIPYEVGIAQAFSKPTVVKTDDYYHMWYSYRSGAGETYRIGYAYSEDGIKWERAHGKCGIDVSDEGWDSEMICYPYVFKHGPDFYMLYNGNAYGKNGFGIAKLV